MMFASLSLMAIAALLPCFMCQGLFNDPLCNNKVCPTGQICRHFKPCGRGQECSVTAICTTTQPSRGGCLHGEPVLHNNDKGVQEILTCYNAAPCPSNAYCSTELQDVSSVCCLAGRNATVKPGVCPYAKPDPSRFWCVDECLSDADCHGPNNKCCYTGCSKDCVYVQPPTPPAPIDLFSRQPPPHPLSINGGNLNPDPCVGMVCPAGQSCRHIKPCGQTENCNVTAICTSTQATRGGCKFGDPVLINNNGRQEELSCYPAAPCPTNAYCSTLLQDISAVCCLSDPAQTMRQDINCPVPVPDPGRFWCVDECRVDGDCDSLSKCCNTGCSKECIPAGTPQPPVVRPPTPPSPLVLSSNTDDPCAGMVCPIGQVCRYYKPCGLKGTCNVTGMCSALRDGRAGCTHGSPLLYNNNGQASMLPCWREAPCPSNAYCSTRLMDTSSRCCLADPARTAKPGTCPAPDSNPFQNTNPIFCYDECKYDGDCDWDSKCCNTGCKLQCVPPQAITIPTPPPMPIRQRDPCDNKLCPANMYCRRRGQPCRHQWSCGREGSCIRCPYLPPLSPGPVFKIGQDPDGCPAVVSRQPPFAPGFGRPRGSIRVNPLTYLLFSDLFQKK